MQPVASGGLRYLHAQQYGVAAQVQLKLRQARKQGLQGAGCYSEAIAGYLYDFAQRTSSQADGKNGAREAFASNYTDFYCFAVFGGYYERDHSAVEEIPELNLLVWFVHAKVVR